MVLVLVVFLELMAELASWALLVVVVQVALLEFEAPMEMLVALEIGRAHV